jgi:hypothetical protein
MAYFGIYLGFAGKKVRVDAQLPCGAMPRSAGKAFHSPKPCPMRDRKPAPMIGLSGNRRVDCPAECGKPLKNIGKAGMRRVPHIDLACSPESISGVSVRVPQP